MAKHTFSENEYYAGFKKIRNGFRKYKYTDLVACCFEYLHAPAKSKIDYLKRNPWLVLLFAKWILLDENYPNRGGKEPTKNDLMKLLQSSLDLTSMLRMPTEYDHYTLFFRNIAYQQFPYQFDFGYRHLSRQTILFSELPDNHLIKIKFFELTGVSIQDFLDLSWILLVRFITSTETILPNGWFDSLSGEYSPDTIEKYLDSISIRLDKARELIKEESKSTQRKSSEHYELTPFVNFPLIRTPDGYLVTETHILYRRIEYYIYDRLRQWDAEKFMAKFGDMFERYAEDSIKYAQLTYITESQLRSALGETGNQIDFIVHEDHSNVFIDTKGVEMSFRGKVTHSTSFLKDQTKQSIVKAITQSHDVIRKLQEKPGSGIPTQQKNYLLVITYKEFYLGSGRSYYEIVAKDKMEEIYGEYKDYPVIPPENMYFITIDEFDFACAMLKTGRITLSEMIEIAKVADENPESRRFDFIQHLHNIPVELEPPSYLIAKKEQIMGKLARLLRP